MDKDGINALLARTEKVAESLSICLNSLKAANFFAEPNGTDDSPIDILDSMYKKHFEKDSSDSSKFNRTHSERLEDALSDIGTPMGKEELDYLKKKSLGNMDIVCQNSFQRIANFAQKLHVLSNIVKDSNFHLVFDEFLPESVDEIFGLDESQITKIISNVDFASKLAKRIYEALHKRTRDCARMARSLNSKFISDGGDFCDFGGDVEFHGGLEHKIGLPDPSVMKAIMMEHLRPENEAFITPNYHICTTPAIELAFIFGREEDIKFMRSMAEQNAKGPTLAELDSLHDEFLKLREINDKILASPLGKYPGEVGDSYTESELTLDVEFKAEYNQGTARSMLAKALAAVFREKGQQVDSNRIVPKAAELRVGAVKAAASSDRPEFSSLVLPLGEKDLTAEWRVEVERAVEDAWGVCRGRVHIVGVRERTWHYGEHADHATFVRQGRRRVCLRELLEYPEVGAGGLRVEEAIITNDYTGPMYMEFNGVLRATTKRSNMYTTSLHCLASAVTKLARGTVLPRERKLWRGLGSRVLCESRFFDRDARGTKGGVERGFLSTTTNIDVAMQYSGYTVDRGTVLEVDFGKVDCPARLDSLSQYPGEGEMLFGPLSYLEAVGCSRLEPYEGSTVLVVPVRINCNLRALTIEETIAKRKRSQVAMIESLIEEIKFDFGRLPKEVLEDNVDPERIALKEDSGCSLSSSSCSPKPSIENADGVLRTAIETMNELLKDANDKLETWFNQDENFRSAWNQALDTKNRIVSSWWLRSFLIKAPKEGAPIDLSAAEKTRRSEKLVNLLSTYHKLYSINSIATQAKLEARNLGAFTTSIDEVGREGLTPLMTNSIKGTLNNVRLLLLAGADTRKEKLGKTAVHMAAEYCQFEVVESLIAMKADANAGCRQIVPILKDAETKLKLRKFHPHVLEICERPVAKCNECAKRSVASKVFRCEPCNYDFCMDCFHESNRPCLRKLKLLGVDGWTPLMVAADDGDMDELKRILDGKECRNWLDAANSLGRTAAHLAAARSDFEIVRLLCEASADVNMEDRDGLSVCDIMKGKCARDMRAGREWTPLMLAVDEGNARQVSQLLAAKAELEARNQSGRTALHIAARRGQMDVVGLLLDARANVDARDAKSRTVLSMVRGNDVRQALMAAGADGWTAELVREERAHLEKLLTADIPLLGGRPLPRNGVVGIYFAGQSYQSCLRFHPKLLHVYHHLRKLETIFEVVYVSSDRNKNEFLEFQGTMPWLAVPYDEGGVRVDLEAKYNDGGRVPALALLDAQTGDFICENAREDVAADPQGKGFPWRPLSIDELLGRKFLLQEHEKEVELKDKYVGILFAGRWCPACQRAAPWLVSAYETVRATHQDFEIIFCSSDTNQSMFDAFYKTMPWLAIAYPEREQQQALSRRFEVQGIPTLIFLTPDREASTVRILPDLAEATFPWPGEPFGKEEEELGGGGCPIQ